MEVLILLMGSFLLSGLMLFTIVKAVMLSYRKQQLSISNAILITIGMTAFSLLLASVLPYLYLRFL
ncbi:hypothetical protein [Exiguobacterium artemiae]|uniref:hypothetical protein n=1 Tax=Exiguobacterium artemiae TaxID=340145 RepID=UPI00047EDC6C|nr:hypothetical protein [Exiguobacterium sibiricum]